MVESASEAREAVAEQAAAGYDFVKVYHTLSAGAYWAAVDEATERGLPVAGHVPNEVGLEGALAAGQASIEHLQGYDEAIEADDSSYRHGWHWSKLYLAMPADTAKIARAAERTAEARVWNAPTLVQQERIAPLETMRGWLSAPEVAWVPAEIRRRWDPAGWDPGYRERLAALGPEETAILERGRRQREALVRALHEAGAGLLVGTDTPNPFVVPGVSVHEELTRLVAAGLQPEDALAAATREAARFLGVLEEVGTVEAGKRADFVLLGANPLEEIGNTRRIEGVMARGTWLSRAELDATLAEVAAAYR